MDFELNEEQRILKKSAHDFLAKECPKGLARELDKSDEGYSPELWQKMADLGWMGLIIPEEYDGIGGSFLDLVVLFEEMGYNICPGPFFSTVVLGGLPILAAGSEEQKKDFLPRIARGEIKLTLALTEPGAGYDPSAIKEAKAALDNKEYVICGTKLFVPDANVADYYLCVTRTKEDTDPEKGLTVFLVDVRSPGVECTPLKTLARDKQCEIVLNNVRVTKENVLGRIDRTWPAVKDVLDKAALARCAEMVGGAQAVMDMALKYAGERTQFNRPIGSFQAIQHHFANMWIDITGSRLLLYKAAWKVSEQISASKEIAMAKARVGDTYRRVTTLGHQIFAGIGFTMEHDMHLYHRRSMAGYLSFGDSDFQREKVARELGL
jgi:alkylation response protein AidB-like acyl-CoA dehydrogenase